MANYNPSRPANTQRKNNRLPRLLWQGRIGPAFWTITSLLSLTVNIVLIVVLIFLGQQLFNLKAIVQDQLIEGLYTNFQLMDQASITTSVQVEDSIPVQFDLPVTTNTTVILTEPTSISGASVVIQTGILDINAPANIVLPQGLALPIALDISVPVDASVPVELTVPVDIALQNTELHEPFVGLQEVVSPYQQLLSDLPNSWEETPFCQGALRIFCQLILTPPQ
ncbi:MAG: hypothetical protein JW862_09990 [Anaerolineales bacterium]|nr:hypothetical protein [Anaerolineales bacterium]